LNLALFVIYIRSETSIKNNHKTIIRNIRQKQPSNNHQTTRQKHPAKTSGKNIRQSEISIGILSACFNLKIRTKKQIEKEKNHEIQNES